MYHFFWYGFRYTFSIKALSWICFFHPYPPEQKNPPSKKIRLVNRHTNNFNNKKEGKFEKKMWPEVEEDKTQWHAAQKLTFCNISLYKNVYSSLKSSYLPFRWIFSSVHCKINSNCSASGNKTMWKYWGLKTKCKHEQATAKLT